MKKNYEISVHPALIVQMHGYDDQTKAKLEAIELVRNLSCENLQRLVLEGLRDSEAYPEIFAEIIGEVDVK